MRVLHLVTGSLYGGVERTLVAMAGQRSEVPDFEQHFAYCFPGRFTDELRELDARAAWLGPVRLRDIRSVLKGRKACIQVLNSERYDAVICHSPWMMVMFGTLIKSAGTRLIFWLHDIPLRQHRALSVLGILERLAMRVRPSLVICNSHFTCAYVSDLYPRTISAVVYCPLTLARPEYSARAEIRREHGVGDDTTVIIQVSRMQEWKGHVMLLSALEQIKENQQWQAWIVGGPQGDAEAIYYSQLKMSALNAGLSHRVKFLGEREDVERLLTGSDIFCQPNSHPEPFGIVFIEAMNAGLPVVSTDWGGAQEIVTPLCGVLAPPGNTRVLSQILQELVNSAGLRRSLGARGPQRAKDLCDAGDRTLQLYELFKKICVKDQHGS